MRHQGLEDKVLDGDELAGWGGSALTPDGKTEGMELY